MPPAVKCTQVHCWQVTQGAGAGAFSQGVHSPPQAVPEGPGTELSQTDGINLQFRNTRALLPAGVVWQIKEEQGQSRDLDGHTETQAPSETALREPKVRAEARVSSQRPSA